MLVEDDVNLREIYAARLSAEGHEVVTASDGEEALATAVKEKPDLIILDVMMPKISGFDVLDILRSTPETKASKVVMMTALSQQSDRERGERLGADLYLVKSQVTLEDVVNSVTDLLKKIDTATNSAVSENTQPNEAEDQLDEAESEAIDKSLSSITSESKTQDSGQNDTTTADDADDDTSQDTTSAPPSDNNAINDEDTKQATTEDNADEELVSTITNTSDGSTITESIPNKVDPATAESTNDDQSPEYKPVPEADASGSNGDSKDPQSQVTTNEAHSASDSNGADSSTQINAKSDDSTQPEGSSDNDQHGDSVLPQPQDDAKISQQDNVVNDSNTDTQDDAAATITPDAASVPISVVSDQEDAKQQPVETAAQAETEKAPDLQTSEEQAGPSSNQPLDSNDTASSDTTSESQSILPPEISNVKAPVAPSTEAAEVDQPSDNQTDDTVANEPANGRKPEEESDSYQTDTNDLPGVTNPPTNNANPDPGETIMPSNGSDKSQ